MIRRVLSFAFAICSVSWMATPFLGADNSLPPIEYSAFLGLTPGNDPTFTTSGGFGVTAIDCQPTVDCLRTTLLPDSASMFEFGFPNESSDAQATVTYFWEITGPQFNGIPIAITYNNTWVAEGTADATSWSVSASLSDTSNRGPIGDVASCGSVTGCTPATQAGVVSSSFFASNVVYQLSLTVSGSIVSDSIGGTFLSATADPVISFGPGFDSTGYSIVLSDGELNGAPATPEPSTGVLIGLALTAALAARGFFARLRGMRVKQCSTRHPAVPHTL